MDHVDRSRAAGVSECTVREMPDAWRRSRSRSAEPVTNEAQTRPHNGTPDRLAGRSQIALQECLAEWPHNKVSRIAVPPNDPVVPSAAHAFLKTGRDVSRRRGPVRPTIRVRGRRFQAPGSGLHERSRSSTRIGSTSTTERWRIFEGPRKLHRHVTTLEREIAELEVFDRSCRQPQVSDTD